MTVDFTPFILTMKLAVITVIVLFAVCMPIVFWLFYSKSPLGTMARAIIHLPLVLPPVVIGFYLLLFFSPSCFVGALLHSLHVQVNFTFFGLVIGSVLFNVPFMVNPILAGLEGLPRSLFEASFICGKGKAVTFVKVLLPAARPAVVTGCVLTLAHTIGEFGMAVMIGGKIPGITKVASIAIYDEVESLNFGNAHVYSLMMLGISCCLVATLFIVNKRFHRVF